MTILTGWVTQHNATWIEIFLKISTILVFQLFFQGKIVSREKNNYCWQLAQVLFLEPTVALQSAAEAVSAYFPFHQTCMQGQDNTTDNFYCFVKNILVAKLLFFLNHCKHMVEYSACYCSWVSQPWNVLRSGGFTHHGLWATRASVNRVKKENQVLV